MEERNDNHQASESGHLTSIVPNLYSFGCGAPATTHIEVYSPNSGDLTGELAVSYYVCAEHTGDAIGAVVTTGFTATQIPPTAHCGAGHDYTTIPGKQLHAPTADVEANLIVKAAVAWLRTINPTPTSPEMTKGMLAHWWHESEMTILEHEEALARFADGQDPGGTPGEHEEKLKAAREDEQAAYGAGYTDGYFAGYTDGLTRAIDPDSLPDTAATRVAEKKEARGLRATLIVFRLGWKIGRGVRKTDYKRAVDLAVRILEERRAAKGAAE